MVCLWLSGQSKSLTRSRIQKLSGDSHDGFAHGSPVSYFKNASSGSINTEINDNNCERM